MKRFLKFDRRVYSRWFVFLCKKLEKILDNRMKTCYTVYAGYKQYRQIIKGAWVIYGIIGFRYCKKIR